MCQHALQNHTPFTYPSNAETNEKLLVCIIALKTKTSEEVPNITFVFDDPPLKIYSTKDVHVCIFIFETPKPDDEEDISNKIMFGDDNKTIWAITVPSTFNMLQKPSSSKAHFDFGLSSSSNEMEGEDNQGENNTTSPRLETTIDGDQENITQGDQHNDDKVPEDG